MAKFFNKDFASELLDPIRLAFVSDPSRADPEIYGDLTYDPKHARSEENHKKWTCMMNEHKSVRKDDQSQINDI